MGFRFFALGAWLAAVGWMVMLGVIAVRVMRSKGDQPPEATPPGAD